MNHNQAFHGILTPAEHSSLLRTFNAFFDDDWVAGDVRGELYCLGVGDDNVKLVNDAAHRLWEAIHRLKTEPFDSLYLNAIALAHRQLNEALEKTFPGQLEVI
jgi:hypothetical protein